MLDGFNRFRPGRWSASTRLAVAAVVVVVVALGITTAVVLRGVQTTMAERAQVGLETNMKLGHELLRVLGGEGPLRLSGEQLVAANGHVLDGTTDLVDKIREIAGGTATIFRGDLRVSTNVSKPDGTRAVGTRLAPGPIYDTVLKNGSPYRGEADILGVPFYTYYEPLRDAEGKTIGILYVGLKKAEFMAVLGDLQRQIAESGGAMLLLSATLLLILVRRTFKPLDALRASMRALASGDHDVAIPALDRADEIGRMASAVQVFKENALLAQEMERQQRETNAHRAEEDEQVRRQAEASAAAAAASLVVGSIGKGLEALSAGDLTLRLDTALPEAYEKLRTDFNAAMEEVAGLVRSITVITSSIDTGSNEIAQAADDLSNRTEQQAASLEQSAAALEQLTTTVRRTAENAMNVSLVVARTKTDAQQSGEIVRKAIGAMGNIERSSKEISQILGVIDGIAFQTNLLALNAGVEAARAGDSGRGFAVVASEVRALAQRSAEAAKQIKTLIAASAGEVGIGVGLVNEAGESLGRIVSQVAEITVSVSEMATAAQEQATGLHGVNAAVNHMDRVTQQNAAMVEESTAASHELGRETAELVQLTKRFRVEPTSAARTTIARSLKVVA